MEHTTMLYDFSSIAIVTVLFILIIIANESGFRIGRFVQNRTDEEIKTLTGAIQASTLGLLALLLGFTFSMSMQRYDNRTEALIMEANAIGTAQLRVQLLPPAYHTPVLALLNDYIELRTAVGTIDLTQQAQRAAVNAQATALQNAL